MFVWLISRTFSANEYYFSLTPNQSTVLSVIAYKPNMPKRTGPLSGLGKVGWHNSNLANRRCNSNGQFMLSNFKFGGSWVFNSRWLLCEIYCPMNNIGMRAFLHSHQFANTTQKKYSSEESRVQLLHGTVKGKIDILSQERHKKEEVSQLRLKKR